MQTTDGLRATAPPTVVAPQKVQRPPFRFVLTSLHLAAFGLVGFTALTVLPTLVVAGLALTFVFGIGLLLLVGSVYAIFGVAWFEQTRVTGLYHLQAGPVIWRGATQPGFKGWLLSLWRQLGDARMWRAVGSFASASVLGAIFLASLQSVFDALMSMVVGFTYGQLYLGSSIIGLLVGAVGVAAMPFLHQIVTVAIIGNRDTEEKLAAEAQSSSQQREGAVRAADLERTRIERDLHDGVQPRLVSVAMTLGLAQQVIRADPDKAELLVAEAHTSTKAAITELRQLARGIYASVLDDRGLDAALSALAARSHIPVQLDVRIPRRVHRDAEAAIYFAIAESLTNAAKHSRASECRVVVRLRDDQTLWARIEDNGIGGAQVVPGGGLDGVMNRVLAAGGTSRLESPHGGPTTLEVSVPCES